MTLHLLPNLLHSNATPNLNFVVGLQDVVNNLDGFFVEDPKEARKYLKHFDFDKLKDKPMEIVNKDTKDFRILLKPLLNGKEFGVVVDSGMPTIADPGSKLVFIAKSLNIKVMAYPGPCAIILALVLSGLDSQQFTFQGYLPRKIDRKIRNIEMTQIFIETPYKNHNSLANLLSVLAIRDTLTIACDLTLPTQQVITQTVGEWHKTHQNYDFHKRPAIFLIKINSDNF